jgi:hypothetical protein
MKKQLLLLATIIIGFSSANAQCTITPSCTPDTQTGYCTVPAENNSLPNGDVGVPYTFAIQLSVGNTAGGGSATITDVTINSVSLPTGLAYTVNPSNATIAGGSNGCIEITGTPTTAVIDFSVDVSVTANTSFGPFPYTLSYLLTINGGTSSLTEVNSPEITLFPNPVNDKLTVTVKEPSTIKVVNVLGTVVMEEKINSSKTMNVSDLKNGIYFVTNTSTGRSIKFIKK